MKRESIIKSTTPSCGEPLRAQIFRKVCFYEQKYDFWPIRTRFDPKTPKPQNPMVHIYWMINNVSQYFLKVLINHCSFGFCEEEGYCWFFWAACCYCNFSFYWLYEVEADCFCCELCAAAAAFCFDFGSMAIQLPFASFSYVFKWLGMEDASTWLISFTWFLFASSLG